MAHTKLLKDVVLKLTGIILLQKSSSALIDEILDNEHLNGWENDANSARLAPGDELIVSRGRKSNIAITQQSANHFHVGGTETPCGLRCWQYFLFSYLVVCYE